MDVSVTRLPIPAMEQLVWLHWRKAVKRARNKTKCPKNSLFPSLRNPLMRKRSVTWVVRARFCSMESLFLVVGDCPDTRKEHMFINSGMKVCRSVHRFLICPEGCMATKMVTQQEFRCATASESVVRFDNASPLIVPHETAVECNKPKWLWNIPFCLFTVLCTRLSGSDWIALCCCFALHVCWIASWANAQLKGCTVQQEQVSISQERSHRWMSVDVELFLDNVPESSMEVLFHPCRSSNTVTEALHI